MATNQPKKRGPKPREKQPVIPKPDIHTYDQFCAAMLEHTRLDSRTEEAFYKVCSMMWHQGHMQPTKLAREVGKSYNTVSKWVEIGRGLGLEQGVKRQVGMPASVSAKAKNPIPGSVAPPAPDPQQMRQRLIDQHYFDALNTHDPTIRSKATESLTKIVPNLKAPEVRVDVQLMIGKGSDERLEASLQENLQYLYQHDTAWVKNLFQKVMSKEPKMIEAADAEMDPASNPDESDQ